MPITRVIDHARRRVTARAVGRLTLADIRDHVDARVREGSVGYAQLFDAREASLDITGEQMRAIADNARSLMATAPYGYTAVVSNDTATFGIARMYEILMDGSNLRVQAFREVDEAEQWLDAQIARDRSSS